MADEIETALAEQTIDNAADIAAAEVTLEKLAESVAELKLAFEAHVIGNEGDFSNLRESVKIIGDDVQFARQQMAALQETLESAADEAEDALREEIRSEVEAAVDDLAEDIEKTEIEIDETAAKNVEEHEHTEDNLEALEEKEETEKSKRHFIRI